MHFVFIEAVFISKVSLFSVPFNLYVSPETKGADYLCGNAQLISTVDFVTRILQFLSYLNPEFKENPASVETPINPLTNVCRYVICESE